MTPHPCVMRSPKYERGDPLPHRRWWRGVHSLRQWHHGRHVHSPARHGAAGRRSGWPKRVASEGGILVQKSARSDISDTQTATFEFDEFPVVWTHRTWGAPVDSEYPWGATIYGDKGTLKMSVNKYEFTPFGKKEPTVKGSAVFEEDKYPEDKTEKDLERHVASAIRGHMRDFLKCIGDGSRPVADIEQGHISTASCILANLSMKLGRSLTWDPATHTVVGDPAATKLLKREYRAGWTHPAGA
ncbi:MAG: hypothetical protein U0746_16075 [Gemmataceae bacterium]